METWVLGMGRLGRLALGVIIAGTGLFLLEPPPGLPSLRELIGVTMILIAGKIALFEI